MMLTVRPAVAADAAWIAALHADSWREGYGDALPAAFLADGLEAERRARWDAIFARTEPGRLILIAEDQGGEGRLGFLHSRPDPDDPADDLIESLHVMRAARGRGLGALLMREAADRLAAVGRRSALLHVLRSNEGARRLYARLGGVETREIEEDLAGAATVQAVEVRWSRLADLATAARAALVERLDPPLAVASSWLPAVEGAPHPVAAADAARGRVKRRLGEPFGLSQYGVNRLELAPGVQSSIPHAHSHEDEFVFVVEGEVWLVSGDAEARLGPGDCAGFAAGGGRPHHLENRSQASAVVLEIGSRRQDLDEVDYPGEDLRIVQRDDGLRVYRRRDGSEIGPSD